jgi:parvulin-like peptidyl-prolyl isomerase
VRSAVILTIVAVVALGGCGRRSDDEVLAQVEGSALSVSRFYASIPEDLLAVMSLDDQEEALRTWVKTELFYQAGLREGVEDDEQVRLRLSEVERELVAEEYIRRFMEGVPDVTEEEARAYFDAHRSEYAMQVRLAHILVRSRQEAERALDEIRSGTPFETVAASVSIDQTASLGGDLGYMRRGEMIHELENVAFGLKVGEVSGVIPSSYGYHIIKVLDRHPGAGQPSFESKRAAVMNFLTSQRRRQAFDERLRELEERMAVVVDTARLRAAAQARIEAQGGGGYPTESGDLPPENVGGESP